MAELNLKKQQMEYIGVTLLVLFALFLGLNRFRKKDKKPDAFSREEASKRWEEVIALESKVPEAEKGISYAADYTMTPFKSPLEDEGKRAILVKDKDAITLPQMAFQGMVWNSVRPQVIINNKIYNIGDTVNLSTELEKVKIKIKDISKEGLRLEYKRQEFIIKPK